MFTLIAHSHRLTLTGRARVCAVLTTGKGAKIFDQDDVQEPAENADIVTFQFLDNGNVWGDYDASAHGIVEAAFQDWVKDPTVSLRPVKSGQACYMSAYL